MPAVPSSTPYVENPNHKPNPRYAVGLVDTSGTAGPIPAGPLSAYPVTHGPDLSYEEARALTEGRFFSNPLPPQPAAEEVLSDDDEAFIKDLVLHASAPMTVANPGLIAELVSSADAGDQGDAGKEGDTNPPGDADQGTAPDEAGVAGTPADESGSSDGAPVGDQPQPEATSATVVEQPTVETKQVETQQQELPIEVPAAAPAAPSGEATSSSKAKAKHPKPTP